MLKALRAAGREVKYYPVDASQTMLEIACAGAEDDDCEALGIKADISSPVHLLLAADVSEAPRLFLMCGNTLAGFDPIDQLRHAAECMHKGDRADPRRAHSGGHWRSQPKPRSASYSRRWPAWASAPKMVNSDSRRTAMIVTTGWSCRCAAFRLRGI